MIHVLIEYIDVCLRNILQFARRMAIEFGGETCLIDMAWLSKRRSRLLNTWRNGLSPASTKHQQYNYSQLVQQDEDDEKLLIQTPGLTKKGNSVSCLLLLYSYSITFLVYDFSITPGENPFLFVRCIFVDLFMFNLSTPMPCIFSAH